MGDMGDGGLPAEARMRSSMISIQDFSGGWAVWDTVPRGCGFSRPNRSGFPPKFSGGWIGLVSDAHFLMLIRCFAVTFSETIEPPNVPGPSVMEGASSLV